MSETPLCVVVQAVTNLSRYYSPKEPKRASVKVTAKSGLRGTSGLPRNSGRMKSRRMRALTSTLQQSQDGLIESTNTCWRIVHGISGNGDVEGSGQNEGRSALGSEGHLGSGSGVARTS